MSVRKFLAAAAVAVTALGGPAVAQGSDEDVRCLLAANLFTRAEQDQTKKQVAVLSAYFYLGRVDARLSGAQLAGALKAQRAAITPQTAGPIMTACAKKMQGAGVALQTLAKQLDGGK